MRHLQKTGGMPERSFFVVVVAAHRHKSRPWIVARAHMPTRGDALAWGRDQELRAVREGADGAGAIYSTEEFDDAQAFRSFALHIEENGWTQALTPQFKPSTVSKLRQR